MGSAQPHTQVLRAHGDRWEAPDVSTTAGGTCAAGGQLLRELLQAVDAADGRLEMRSWDGW